MQSTVILTKMLSPSELAVNQVLNYSEIATLRVITFSFSWDFYRGEFRRAI
jgi:hypothetical protein